MREQHGAERGQRIPAGPGTPRPHLGPLPPGGEGGGARCPGRPPVPETILLVETIANRQVVIHGCEGAAEAGVRAGMTLAHARALLGPVAVRVRPARPQRDGEALRALALWATRFAPAVAPDPPDGLLADISGCQFLFRGERRLIQMIRQAVQRLGFHARLAAAPTFGCAWAVARFGTRGMRIVSEEELRDALRPLPIAALRVGPDTEADLSEVGIERIGDLFAVPRAAFPSRFGNEPLLRLDQATGEALEMIRPVQHTEPPRVERLFAGPVQKLEAIELTVRQLLDELAARLQDRESGAQRLDLELKRFETGPLRLSATLSRPSRDVRHLWSLLRPRVEKANLGHGVERVRITASHTGTLRHQQHRCLDGEDSGEIEGAFGRLLDIMAGRIGPDRVVRMEPARTHIPERIYRPQPACGDACGAACLGGGTTSGDPSGGDRPSVLFDPPQPILVIAVTPDGPPSRLRWNGREHRIVATIGPQRIGEEWWRGRHEGKTETSDPSQVPSCLSARDYFKVSDEGGRWLWVFRDHASSQWFVHGQWA